jgi:hypothetical protein
MQVRTGWSVWGRAAVALLLGLSVLGGLCAMMTCHSAESSLAATHRALGAAVTVASRHAKHEPHMYEAYDQAGHEQVRHDPQTHHPVSHEAVPAARSGSMPLPAQDDRCDCCLAAPVATAPEPQAVGPPAGLATATRLLESYRRPRSAGALPVGLPEPRPPGLTSLSISRT